MCTPRVPLKPEAIKRTEKIKAFISSDVTVLSFNVFSVIFENKLI